MTNSVIFTQTDNKIKISHAIGWILLSVIVICTPAAITLNYFRNHLLLNKATDPANNITTLVQKSKTPDFLPTLWFAEQLQLSIDKPINLYLFDTQTAENTLKKNSLIKKASIEKIPPNALLVNYELRTPLFFLSNFTNTGISDDGCLIPLKPFFTPKNLPALFLPEEQLPADKSLWNNHIDQSLVLIAKYFFHNFTTHPALTKYRMTTIDFSHIFSPSLGKKQIIISLTPKSLPEQSPTIFLRIDAENYRACLCKFLKLITEKPIILHDKSLIIDLRLPRMAFLSRNNLMQNVLK